MVLLINALKQTGTRESEVNNLKKEVERIIKLSPEWKDYKSMYLYEELNINSI